MPRGHATMKNILLGVKYSFSGVLNRVAIVGGRTSYPLPVLADRACAALSREPEGMYSSRKDMQDTTFCPKTRDYSV